VRRASISRGIGESLVSDGTPRRRRRSLLGGDDSGRRRTRRLSLTGGGLSGLDADAAAAAQVGARTTPPQRHHQDACRCSVGTCPALPQTLRAGATQLAAEQAQLLEAKKSLMELKLEREKRVGVVVSQALGLVVRMRNVPVFIQRVS
jgi:hypothetical protein